MQDLSNLSVDELLLRARQTGEGTDERPANLGEALAYAEEAARRDSADGYHEITRIVGSACIASADLPLKEQYATYLIMCCDPDTVLRHKRSDTAYNVGTVCEYMADTMTICGEAEEAEAYRMQAETYYNLALTIAPFAPTPANRQAAQASRDGLHRLSSDNVTEPPSPTRQRPLQQPKAYVLQ